MCERVVVLFSPPTPRASLLLTLYKAQPSAGIYLAFLTEQFDNLLRSPNDNVGFRYLLAALGLNSIDKDPQRINSRRIIVLVVVL